MVRGLESWNIDQYAVWNNRPDKILEKIPGADRKLSDHYYQAYLKRLTRQGLRESQASESLEVPEVSITRIDKRENTAALDFSITTKAIPVSRYHIYVNNVPLFGSSGKAVETADGKAISVSENVHLTPGVNKIEISAMNVRGNESLRALTYVTSERKTRPDLYYIGFGVSSYKNPELNLRFADKDVFDLSEAIRQQTSLYGNVFVHTFTNYHCSVENIKSAKGILKNAKPEDTLILFIAGHGIHDTDKDSTYYFLTYEADLANLSQTAANFDLIEDILQG
jgi:hypothetical protein